MMDLWTPTRQKPPLGARLLTEHPLVKTKLLACWLCNEGGGGRLLDLTRRYHGTIIYIGGLSWGRSKKWGGHALLSAATVTTSTGVTLSGLPTLTTYAIEAWLWSTGSDTYGCICSEGNAKGLFLHTEKLDFYSGGDHNGTASLVAGEPTHIVVTTRGTGSMEYWLNGKLDTTASFTVPTFSPTTLLNDNSSENLIGGLDFLALYKAELTPAEIQQRYRAPHGLIDSPLSIVLGKPGMTDPHGTLTVTLGALSVSATGTLALQGSLAATLDALTVSATGMLALTGSLDATLEALTLSASGAGTITTTGSLDATLAPLTVSATGTLPIVGSLSATIATLTLSATGEANLRMTGAITLGAVTVAGSLFIPLLEGSTAWLAAAAHGATLSRTSGTYSPVVLIDFLDYALTIGSHSVPFATSTTFRSDLGRLLDGGIGTITRELDEMADIIRLGGTSLTLLYTDELRQIFAARPLEMTKVRIRLGFLELTDVLDFKTIFQGTVDRVTRTWEMWQLTLIDDSIAQDRNLNVPLGPPLFPQAPSDNQSKNIPVIVGVVTGMVLPQVAGGTAAGTLGRVLGTTQTVLYMPETEVIWPATGAITVGAEAMSYTSERLTAVEGVPYRALEGLDRSSPSTHAVGTAVTLTSTNATFVLGWGVHTLNALYLNGAPIDGSDVDVTSVEVLGRTVPLVIIQTDFDPTTDIITADVNAETPVLVDVPWVEDTPDPPPGTPPYDGFLYMSSFGAGGGTSGTSHASIVEEHSLDPLTWTFTHPPDDPIDYVAEQYLGTPAAGYLLQVLADAPGVWGEDYQQNFGLDLGAFYEFTLLYRSAANPFGTPDDHSDAALQLGTADVPGLYADVLLPTGIMLSGVNWNSYNTHFTATTDTLRVTLRTMYASTAAPSWFMAIGVRRAASPLDTTTSPHPVVPMLTQVDGVNPVDAILFLIALFYPNATYKRQAFLEARAKLEQAPPWRFRGVVTNPGSSNTLLQRMAQQCKSLVWLNASNEYDMMFLDDSRPIVLELGDQWNIVNGSLSQTNNPPDSIFTSIYLYYDTDQGGSTNVGDYRGWVFVTPTEGSTQGDASALVAVMAETYAWSKRDNRLTFFADFVNDLSTAAQLLAWLVARYGGHKDLCTFTTYIDAVPLRLGQMVHVEHPVLGIAPGTTMDGEVVRWAYEPGTTEVQLTARILAEVPAVGILHLAGAIALDPLIFNTQPPGVFAATGQSGQLDNVGVAFQAHFLGKAPNTLADSWQDLSDNTDDSNIYGTAVYYHGQTFLGSMPRSVAWQEDPGNTFVPATLWADGLQLAYDLGATYGVFASAVFSITDLAYFGTLPQRVPYILGIRGGAGTYGDVSMDFPAQQGCSYRLDTYYKNILYPFGTGSDHSDCALQIGTPSNPTLYADVTLATGSLGDGTAWDSHSETWTVPSDGSTTTRFTFRSKYATHAVNSYFHHMLVSRTTLPTTPPAVDEGDDAGYLLGPWTESGGALQMDFVAEVDDPFTSGMTTVHRISTPIAPRSQPQVFALSDIDLTSVYRRDEAYQVSALGEFDGKFYAALENSSIYGAGSHLSLWVSEDGSTWSFLRASLTDFIDEAENFVTKITSFCVFGGALWAAAHNNASLCKVYRSDDGAAWTEHHDFSVTNGRTYQLATDGTTLFLGLGVEEATGASKRAEVWRCDGTTWTLDIDLGAHPTDPTDFPCVTALHWSSYHQVVIAGTGDPLDTQASETEHNIRFYRRDISGAWVLDEDMNDFDYNLPVCYDMAEGILLSGG